ncbi:MAG: hypothetical protein U0Q18_20330 [Bryobacteraceae bacterium]
MNRKLLKTAYWIVPSLFCLLLYWPGLRAWFQADDFVWLNLPNQAHGFNNLLDTLFHPTVQGTWRPLSERVFFLLFGVLFGADALPYRIWVFLTMFANLALLAAVTKKLTGSRAAGFWAAILWVGNSKLATVMSWTCEYILVACGFFLLLALYFFLRYVETAERRYYFWTWGAFLAGFLAMETNVVFPVLVGSYAFFCARKYFRSTLPFFVASAAYAFLHLILAPNHGTVAYTIHLDGALPATFWSYWRRAFEPVNIRLFSPFPPVAGTVQMLACTLALLGFAIYQARKKQWLPAVLLGWYAVTLGPVVPLRDHISDYYLTLPVMWLAVLGAYALVYAWQQTTAWKVVSAAIAAMFLVQSIPVARRSAEWFRVRSKRVQMLVMGVARAHELHPGKVILLDGLNDEQFWGAIAQRPFLFLRIPDVYLAPGAEAGITAHTELDEISRYVLPASEARRGIQRGQIVVYRAGDGPLRNITKYYEVPADTGAGGPLRVDMSDPLVDEHLGPTWYARENAFRWMPRSASVHMAGPRSAGQKLYLTAICPGAQLERGPLPVTVTVDGVPLPPVEFTKGNTDMTFTLPLPAATVGKTEIEIRVDAERTVHIGQDTRELSLAFGRFEIK